MELSSIGRVVGVNYQGRFMPKGDFMPMNRNVLLLTVAVLCVAVGVLGYKVYEDNREPKGVQINLGPSGITVDKK
jgi:hypothetical protein